MIRRHRLRYPDREGRSPDDTAERGGSVNGGGAGVGDGFDEILASFDPRVRDLAVRTRALIADV